MAELKFGDVDAKKDMWYSAIYGIYIVFLIFLGYWALTAGRAQELETNMIRFWTYVPMMFASFLWVVIIKWLHHISKATWTVAYLHDSEFNIFRALRVFADPKLLFILCLIVFSGLGLFSALAPQSALAQLVFPWSVGRIPQQATKGGELLFAGYVAPAENGLLYLTIALIVSAEMFIATRKEFSEKLLYSGVLFMILLGLVLFNGFPLWLILVGLLMSGLAILPPLAEYFSNIIPNSLFISFLWSKMHVGVSGGVVTREASHYLFGFNNAFLVQFTGSIIPTELYHLTNNIFIKAKELFGSQPLLYVFILILLIGIILFIVLLLYEGKEK